MQEVPRRRRLDLARAGGEHQPGPAQRERTGDLGEVALEAHDEPDPSERRVVERRDAVAGCEDGVLPGGTVEVRLAVPGGKVTLGIEHQHRVVHRAVFTELGQAPGDEEAVSPRPLGEAHRPWTVPRLGVPPCVVGQRLGVVAARPQLGQDEQLHPAGGGVVDHAQGDREVLLGLARRGQPLRHADQEVSLHIPTGPVDSSRRRLLCTVRAQRSGRVSRL